MAINIFSATIYSNIPKFNHFIIVGTGKAKIISIKGKLAKQLLIYRDFWLSITASSNKLAPKRTGSVQGKPVCLSTLAIASLALTSSK